MSWYCSLVVIQRLAMENATLRLSPYHTMWPSEKRAWAKTFTGRVYVQHVRLNSGGYDSRGNYFGVGSRLYFVWDEDCIIEEYHRASDRADAVAIARDIFPVAKIQL